MMKALNGAQLAGRMKGGGQGAVEGRKLPPPAPFLLRVFGGLRWVSRLRLRPLPFSFLSLSRFFSLNLFLSFSPHPLNRVFLCPPIPLLAISPVGFNLWRGCGDVLPTLSCRFASMLASWQGLPTGRECFSAFSSCCAASVQAASKQRKQKMFILLASLFCCCAATCAKCQSHSRHL